MDLWTLSYVGLWLLVLLEGCVLVLLLRGAGMMFLGTREGISRDGLPIGRTAPPFKALDSHARSISLDDYRGSWVVMIFAATSCEICWRLIPELRGLRESLAGAAEVVIMLRDDVHAVAEYAKAAGDDVPIVAIGRRGVVQAYKVRVSPFAHVVDPDGVVRAKGLVNDVEHVEHLLYEAGVRHPRLVVHGQPSPAGVNAGA